MLHSLISKVTKFQLPTPKRFSTVVKSILEGENHVPPCQIGLINSKSTSWLPSSVLILNNNSTHTIEGLLSQRKLLLLQDYPKIDYKTIKSFAKRGWKMKLDLGIWVTELPMGMWVIGYELSTRADRLYCWICLDSCASHSHAT